jgi:hypothetical protein
MSLAMEYSAHATPYLPESLEASLKMPISFLLNFLLEHCRRKIK